GGGGGLGDLEAEFSTGAFEALERDFQEVLAELVGDKSLEKFRVEYEKLHRALRKSHEQEKRLVKKCRELNAEIVNNAAKVQTALKLSQEDQANIAALRKEIDRRMVEAAHQKEERAKETIGSLKEEIEKLSKLVEKGAGLSMGQENQVKELKKEKEELYARLEEQGARGRQFEAQLEELFKQKEELEAGAAQRAAEAADLRAQLDRKGDELRRGQKHRENLTRAGASSGGGGRGGRRRRRAGWPRREEGGAAEKIEQKRAGRPRWTRRCARTSTTWTSWTRCWAAWRSRRTGTRSWWPSWPPPRRRP
ncbi:unnamed protein product, partial [Heterosigma akashiwo]